MIYILRTRISFLSCILPKEQSLVSSTNYSLSQHKENHHHHHYPKSFSKIQAIIYIQNMEIESLLPKSTNGGGVNRYLRRRFYQRLDRGATGGKKKMKIMRLGIRSPRRFWRIRAIPKLRWVMRSSPLKLLTKLKNGYMNFMMRLASHVGALNTDHNSILGGKRIPKARQVSSKKGYSIDAFEARLIFEISKTLVASHELYSM